MNPRLALSGILVAGTILLSGCTPLRQHAGSAERVYREEVSAGLEQIYVVRTTRTRYLRGTTPACAAAPFTAASEQHYDTWSLMVQSSDGRVVKTHEKRVGEFLACFGAITPSGTFAMYSPGTNDSLPYTGIGECRFMKSKAPAPKLLVLNCSLDLSGLPADYVGGYATASSLAPSGGEDAIDVRGYLSTSVITFRLWKKPK
jgi:hypothetical protein